MSLSPSDTVRSGARILITGGSGFIGTNLVEHYRSAGISVLNLDISEPRNPAHRPLWEKLDLLNRAELEKTLLRCRPTHIFHLAARTDLAGNTAADYSINTVGTTHLINASALIPDLSRIIFASSRMVCRIGYTPMHERDYCPSTVYGASKVESERVVYEATALKCDWLLVRPTSIWGPWFQVPYRRFFDAILRGRYLHPGDRRVRKSFGYVGNTVFQLDRLMFADPASVHRKMFYLCDSPPLEVLDFAEEIRKQSGAPRIRSAPIPLLRFAAALGDLLQRWGVRNPPLTRFRLDNLLTEMLYETARLNAVCGLPPSSMIQGVKATLDWMQAT